jgi:hypothetical protein
MTNYIHMTVAHFDQIKKRTVNESSQPFKNNWSNETKKINFFKTTRHLKFQPFSFQVSIWTLSQDFSHFKKCRVNAIMILMCIHLKNWIGGKPRFQLKIHRFISPTIWLIFTWIVQKVFKRNKYRQIKKLTNYGKTKRQTKWNKEQWHVEKNTIFL